MKDWLRGKLTFANVVSLIALFIALGGGAYAVKSNSVGRDELADKSVGFRELTPRVHTEIAKGAVRAVLQSDGPAGMGTDPCSFYAGGLPCQNAAGKEHKPAPWVGASYTITCPSGQEVAVSSDELGDTFPTYTLVTNAENWQSVGQFAGSRTSDGGYTAMTYGFQYYAFDTDHVQGYAACIPTQ